MRVRCPHCHDSTEIEDDTQLSGIACAVCGSKFSLVGDQTLAYTGAEARTIGHFKLIDRIGTGAFGTVWLARDRQLDRDVAIKVPRQGQLASGETDSFIREARAAAQLKHPNIVAVHEVGCDDGQVYIVSDYVEGLTLADWLIGQQPPFHVVAELCAKIADAIDHAHEAGVIHRDLKPTNIIIGSDNEPHVMDFGLAKRDAAEVTVTMEGKLLGTPAYMSPEQARGEAHQADRRSDVYSLGIILFELLTGHKPFRGNVRMLLQQVINEDAPSTRRLNSNIPRDLDTICLKCLEKAPEKRYSTARELSEELRRFVRGEPIHARAIGTSARIWRWSKRNPIGASLVMCLLFMAIAGPIVAINQTAMKQSVQAANENLERQVYLNHLAAANGALLNRDYLRAEFELSLCPEDQRKWEWFFLSKRLHSTFTSIDASAGPPILARDGDLLIVIDETDGHQVKIWDLTTKTRDPPIFEHAHELTHCALSADQQWLAAGDAVGGVIVWDRESGKRRWFDDDQHDDKIDGLAFSPDGRFIASVGWDGRLKVVYAADGHEHFSKRLIPRQETSIHLRGVSISPDSRWIATSIHPREALLIDIQSEEEEVERFPGEGHMLPTFSPDRERIATGNVDGSIRLWHWDGESLEEEKKLLGNGAAVWALAFNADGTQLASGHWRSSVRLWDLEAIETTGNEPFISFPCHDYARSLTFHPKDKQIAIFTIADGVIIWRYEPKAEGTVLKLFTNRIPVRPVKFSPDGRKIAIGTDDPAFFSSGINPYYDNPSEGDGTRPLVVIDAKLHNIISRIESIDGVAWADNRHFVGSTTPGFEVQLIDVDTGKPVRSFKGHTTRAVSFCTNLKEIVSIAQDRTVRAWDLGTGHPKHAFDLLSESKHPISSVAVSPSGKHIAVAFHWEWDIEAWETRTEKRQPEISALGRYINQIVFKRNEREIFVGSNGGKLSLYDIQRRQELATFTGHRGNIWALAINPDESQIVAGDSSGQVIVWDVERQQPLVTLANSDVGITSLDWSPDGKTIVAGKEDGTVQLWDLPAAPK